MSDIQLFTKYDFDKMNENIFKLLISNFFVIALVIKSSSARLAPSYLTPCPGLTSECLKKTVQDSLPLFAKGIPELRVSPIDPLKKEHITLKLPGGFKVEFNNGTMTGLRKCHIDSVTYQNKEADLKMHCNLTIKGRYKAYGKILIVSINGDGEAKIKTENSFMHAKIRFHDKIRDGVIYYEVKDFDISFDYGDRVTFVLTNLFKGNTALSEAVLQFLNENWKQVTEEFGQPIVDELIDIIYKIVKKFFEIVPKNELFVD